MLFRRTVSHSFIRNLGQKRLWGLRIDTSDAMGSNHGATVNTSLDQESALKLDLEPNALPEMTNDLNNITKQTNAPGAL
jgi:hypothetical protein